MGDQESYSAQLEKANSIP